MSDLIQVIESEADFTEATKSGIVLVDFFATWCRPCRMQLPVLEQIAGDYAGKVKIIKVDTDRVQKLAIDYGISSIPTLVLLKNGQKIDQLVSLQQADTLKKLLDSALQ